MFTVSIIYSTKEFLDYIRETLISSKMFEESFRIFNYTDSELVLDLAFHCKWAKISSNGVITLTERGLEISKLDLTDALLLQLEDMIFTFNPHWAALLPKGRKETKNFLPKDVLQCFKESGLFGELDSIIIGAWDRLAMAYRNYHQENLLITGRKGEELSLEYERKRTNSSPIWQAVESNLSGYDILSKLSESDPGLLKIEVKSTTSRIGYASFHISKNEWKTSEVSNNYIFHLWDLREGLLYIIDKDIISKHIPTDNGSGDWREVMVPFQDVISYGHVIKQEEVI
jgi:Protein NO VEIN, C-terminal